MGDFTSSSPRAVDGNEREVSISSNFCQLYFFLNIAQLLPMFP